MSVDNTMTEKFDIERAMLAEYHQIIGFNRGLEQSKEWYTERLKFEIESIEANDPTQRMKEIASRLRWIFKIE